MSEEGSRLLVADRMAQIRLRLELLQTGLESLISKNTHLLNAQRTCIEDLKNWKDCYVVELEQKNHSFEEKLKQAIKREDELLKKIASLTQTIDSFNHPSLSNVEVERLQPETIGQAVREQTIHVEKIIEKLVDVPVFVERIAEFEREFGLVEVKQVVETHRPRQPMEFIRKCTLEEQILLEQQYLKIKQQLEKRSEKILLYYTYRNDKPHECNCSHEFRQWVKNMIEELEPGAGCQSISQAFILNPKDNQLAQDYHLDYNGHMRTFFVSMDYITTLNSTQYFREPLQQACALSLRGGIQYGNDEKTILDRQNRDFMEVSQMICKPFCILLMRPGTAHRGIANRSGVDRVIFSVTYTDIKGFWCGQPKIATQKQDIQ